MAKKPHASANKTAATRQGDHGGLWLEYLIHSPAILRTILVIAVVGVYLTSLDGNFVFDDIPHLVNRPDPANWPGELQRLLHGRTRSVTMLSFAINAAAFGKGPISYHATNLVIHVASVLILFGLVRRAIMLVNDRSPTGLDPNLVGFLAALLWGVHPLGTMAVTYIIQRHESLMAMFYLLMLYCLICGRMADRAWPWYIGAIFSCWLGMGAKEVMVTAPIVALLFDRVILSDSWRDLLRNRGWVYGVIALPAVLLIYKLLPMFFSGTKAHANVFGTHEMASPWLYLWTQSGVIVYYLRLAIWPDYLSVDYEWPVTNNPWEYLPTALIVLCLLGTSLWLLFRGNPLGVVATAFFLILAPTSSFLPIVDVVFEHRVYLPLACVCILITVGACFAISQWMSKSSAIQQQRLTFLVGCTIALLLGARTIYRNMDYRTEVTLWNSAVESRPMNLRANHNLAQRLREAGRPEEAERRLLESIQWCQARGYETFPLQGDLAELYVYMGAAETAYQRFQLAIQEADKKDDTLSEYGQKLRDRKLAEIYTSYGALFDLLGRPADAAQQFDKAISLRPDVAQWYVLAGDAYRKSGNAPRALERWKHAVESDGKKFGVQRDFGLLLADQGNYEEAMPFLKQSLAKNQGDLPVRFKIVQIQAAAPVEKIRDPETAIAALQELQKSYPEHSTEFLEVEAMALSSAGKFDEAIQVIETLRKQTPKADSNAVERLDQMLSKLREMQPLRLPPAAASAPQK